MRAQVRWHLQVPWKNEWALDHNVTLKRTGNTSPEQLMGIHEGVIEHQNAIVSDPCFIVY